MINNTKMPEKLIGTLFSNISSINRFSMNSSMDSERVIMDEDATRLSPALLLSFTIALAFLITVGVVGNVMVIFALIRTRAHNMTTTNAYILNLSIADLLFLIFCVPFQGTVYILNDWPFGAEICKAAHYCQYYTTFASIWLLTVMSIDRYLAIGHPLKSVNWRSPDHATRICIFVWCASAVFSIPWLILYTTFSYMTHLHANVTACYDGNWSESTYQYRKWLFFGVVTMGFVIPSSIIFCMAVLIAKSIRSASHQPFLYQSNSTKRSDSNGSSMPSNGPPPSASSTGCNWNRSDAGAITKRRKRVVYLVFALALVFILCWLPQNVMHMWQNFHPNIMDSMRGHYRVYFIIKLIGHILTYVNSSINPILYSLASGQFRSRLAHAMFNSGSFRPNTANRIRLDMPPGAAKNGQGDGRRSKQGSFQPLLSTNQSRASDDQGYSTSVGPPASRRSSRGVTQTLTVPPSPVRFHFDAANGKTNDEAAFPLASF